MSSYARLNMVGREELKSSEGEAKTAPSQEEQKGAPEEKRPEEDEIVSNWDQKVDSFEDLQLKESLLRGIYGYGFQKPSPIQQKGILPLLRGKDTIAQVNFMSHK